MDQIDFFFKNYQSTTMYNFFLNVKKYFSMTNSDLSNVLSMFNAMRYILFEIGPITCEKFVPTKNKILTYRG